MREMLASQKVYKQHSFYKYDTNFKRQRNDITSTELKLEPQEEEKLTFTPQYSCFIITKHVVPNHKYAFDKTKPSVERNSSQTFGAITQGFHTNSTGYLSVRNKNLFRSIKNILPVVNNVRKIEKFPPIHHHPNKHIKANILTQDNTKGNWRKLFPGEKCSRFGINKFLEAEKQNILWGWSAETTRKRITKRLLQNIHVPAFVERSKTTSAIFREYSTYKDHQKTSC